MESLIKVGDVFRLRTHPTVIWKVITIRDHVVEYVFLSKKNKSDNHFVWQESKKVFCRAYDKGHYVLIPDPPLTNQP
jgi:hypothetical protein